MPSGDSEREGDAARDADDAEVASGADSALVTFTTLVLSMSTTALVQLGDAPLEFFEDGNPPPKNLPMAKHTIDMLTLLEEKTQGNLDGEEERLLGQVLYDLRLRYVAACKKK